MSIWQFQNIDQCSKKELYDLLKSLDNTGRLKLDKNQSVCELREKYRRMLRAQLKEFRKGEIMDFQRIWR
jgi:hypothetical protein